MTKRTKLTRHDKLGKLAVGRSTYSQVNMGSAIHRAKLKYGYQFSTKQTSKGLRITRVA